MWKEYELTMKFTGRLCGSVPQAKELIRPWLEARAPAKAPEGVGVTLPTLEELEEEVAATINQASEVEERITLGFQRDPEGRLFVRSGTVKAHIKDCALQISKMVDVKNFRAKVANAVFVEPDRLLLLREDGATIKDEDGDYEQAVHVMTMRGPRNALKRIRYVEHPVIRCTIKVLDDGVIREKHLRLILDYGSVHGYGGERSMGEGRYTYTLEARE